jgi:hypothetical protein
MEEFFTGMSWVYTHGTEPDLYLPFDDLFTYGFSMARRVVECRIHKLEHDLTQSRMRLLYLISDLSRVPPAEAYPFQQRVRAVNASMGTTALGLDRISAPLHVRPEINMKVDFGKFQPGHIPFYVFKIIYRVL